VTTADNVRAQRRLLSELFGVTRIAGVYGFSMGAQQAYHWAGLFPEAVERAIVVCGSARTSVHNKVFLLSLLATLDAAPEHIGGGRFSSEPRAALRAFARTYAGWAMSQDWYRAGLHLTALGATDLDDFLDNKWEVGFTRRTAADLYAQATTWLHSDISANALYEGDLVRALNAIRARILLCHLAPTYISRSLTTRPNSRTSCRAPSGRSPRFGGTGRAVLSKIRRI
jgi:homoserine O-acetyltransferase/O-succinyltransferase